jgi:serine/threonine protein kinase/tetratricopeptide (TPR) repeat protein
MSTDRWQRLNQVFHGAVKLPAEQRAEFLARECAGDAPMRAELERLIRAHERADAFLGQPAIDSVGSWLDEEISLAAAGQRFGPYRVIREIGRGGMGAVYLAERADGQFQQRVALKLIKHGMDIDLVLQRFRAERQILATLQHPNIARLLDGGTSDDGRPYFVMEHIEGEPIDRFAEARALSLTDRLQLFLQVCDAVTYAHRERVIHRDIKPVNILVTADGVPKLLDFGIAKVLEPGAEETTSAVTGFRLLTPEYASPEQVEGRHATPVSDVYSLGVVLYELLTGSSPYRARSRDPLAVAAAVRTEDPPRPSTTGDHKQLRGDLDTIVLAALRKDPARRYQSVQQMADDVRRYLDGLPVLARRDSIGYRAGKFIRRNRATVIAAGIAGLSTSLLAVAGLLALRSGEQPSLLETGALAERDRILVAGFTDSSGDTLLAAAITEAFRIDLSQSPHVRVMTPAQVRGALERMQRSPDVVLDDSLARDLAVREGAKAVVSGAISRLGGAYTITVQVLSAEPGELLFGDRQRARDSTALLAALDRASAAVRQRMGESLSDLRSSPALEKVTTASLTALRKYTEGYRLFLAGDRTQALRKFEEAIAIDTGFAGAHGAMGSIYSSMAEPGRARLALQHSIANRDRLPFIERQFLVAGTAYSNGEYETTIKAYDEVLKRFPRNIAALNNLALAYRDSRRFEQAEQLWQRSVQIDSGIPVLYYGIHSSQAFQGKFAESRKTLDVIGRRFPNDGLLPVVEVQDAAARQAWTEAERLARANVRARQDTLQLVDAYEALAGIVMTRGRLNEARQHWRTQQVMSAASGSAGRRIFGALQLAYVELRYRNDPAQARAVVESVLSAQPLDSIFPADRPYYELARFHAAIGDLPRAHALLASADETDRMLGRNRPAEQSWTRGVIAAAEKRVADAETDLRRASETLLCAICPLPDLARAYEAAGNKDAALRAHESYVATPWLWRYETDALELGFVFIRLGELYEERGDTASAKAAYTKLLNLWQQPDPALQTITDSVKHRLIRLGAAA